MPADTNILSNGLFLGDFRPVEAVAAAETIRLTPLQQTVLQARLERAYALLQADAQATGGRVLGAPEDQVAALVLQALAEQMADSPDSVSSPDGQEVMFDNHDLLRWLGGMIVAGAVGFLNKEKFRDPPAAPQAMDDGPKRIAVLGDWGSGLYGAPVIGKAIAKDPGRFDLLLHLGDIYYAATERSVKDRFFPFWPDRKDAISRALNSNHEMYTGGGAYFKTILPKFGQSSSVFAMRSAQWLIVGLDTGYDEADLAKDQAEWLTKLLDDSPGRQVILFTHHQGCSFYDKPAKKAVEKLEPLLKAGRVHYWYWGHEHRCVLFDRHPEWKLWGRCIGHSGFPAFRLDDYQTQGKTLATPDKDQVWLPVPAREGAPSGYVLDGPNRYVDDGPERYNPNGYLTLELDGTQLVERIHDADGRVLARLERRADGRTVPVMP